MLEKMFNLYQEGYRYEIGPDNDGLDMIEIRYYEDDETKSRIRISFTKQEGKLIAQALLELTKEV